MSTLPMLGNLAWAPVPNIENVEVLDRFNGVPTLGVFSAAVERTVFWRVLGYVPENISVWLYAPVDERTGQRIACDDPSDLLTGLLFESPHERYVTVGVASDYRLVFEREWHLLPGLTPDDLIDELLDFLVEAIEMMLRQDLPPSRREMMRKASRAVRELQLAGR